MGNGQFCFEVKGKETRPKHVTEELELGIKGEVGWMRDMRRGEEQSMCPQAQYYMQGNVPQATASNGQ